MAETSARDRAVGQWVLAGLFALGAIAALLRVWNLVSTNGFDLRTTVWILAVVGFASLSVRSVAAARRATTSSREEGAREP